MIAPFAGAIFIVVGLVMAFAGAKFLFIVISLCLGLFISAILFLVTYGLFIDPTSPKAKTITIVLLVVSVITSIIIMVLSYKITYKFAVPAVAGLAGALAGYMLYNVSGIGNKVDKGAIWIQLAFAVVGGAVGLFVGKKLQFYVKTIGTAFIGAVMIILGVSFYLGHLVPNKGDPYSKYVWGYVGA